MTSSYSKVILSCLLNTIMWLNPCVHMPGLLGAQSIIVSRQSKHNVCMLLAVVSVVTCCVQEDQFGMYALYSKNKPQSDALLSSHGNEFFKVRPETPLWLHSSP